MSNSTRKKRRLTLLESMHEPELEAASLERVARGVQAVTEALARVEGLTPSERTQVLLSIAVFDTARNVATKLRERFTGQGKSGSKKDSEPEPPPI